MVEEEVSLIQKGRLLMAISVTNKKAYLIGITTLAGATFTIAASVLTDNVRPLSVFVIGLLLLGAWIEINVGLDQREEETEESEYREMVGELVPDALDFTEPVTDTLETELIYRILQCVLFAGGMITFLTGLFTRLDFFFYTGLFLGFLLSISFFAEALLRMRKHKNANREAMKKNRIPVKL